MVQKKNILQRLFNIYPGEEKNALLFAGLGFLWAFAATCGLKFADALFLLHVGAESLPQAYTLTACGMLGVACFLLYAFHKLSSYHIYLTTLALGLIFYILVFICLTLNPHIDVHWFWYSLKLAGFFLFAVLMTCYWTFIDQYHHMQDAKRLYSLFSSTIFLGAGATGLVMHSGFLDLNDLILLIIALLAFTFYRVKKIASLLPQIGHEEVEQGEPLYEQGNPFKFLIKSILASPFTLSVMACNFIIYLLLVITEYNYMFTFENHFASLHDQNAGGGTEAQLTLFLGECLATVSTSNLIFGLFIYSRLVRRFGLHLLLMVTPILLIIAFTGWTFSTSLIFPLIGFFVVEGTLYVIDDSNFNLLLNAVPSKLKYKIRAMIESFFEPVGMLVSAILLSFFQEQSKILGLILAVCLLCVAYTLRSRYLQALLFNLSENAVHFQRSVSRWIEKMSPKQQITAENRLLAMLKLGDDQAQLFACEGLLAFDDSNILKKLLSNTSYMDPKAKIKLIRLLEKSEYAMHAQVLDKLQQWVQEDFDIDLKSCVHFYLAKKGLLHPEKVINDLKSEHIELRGAAIISLKKSLAFLPAVKAAANHTLAAHHLKMLLDSQNESALCMGLQILGIEGESCDVDILISYLRHPSIKVARAAANALVEAQMLDSVRQAPLIVSQLSLISDSEVRMSCLKALEVVNDSSLVEELILSSLHFRPNERRQAEIVIDKIGLRTVPVLLAILKNCEISDRCRLLAGRILGNLALSQLRANLSEIIKIEIDRAYFYFYHAHTIQSLNKTVDLSNLVDVLLTDYHSIIDFIIQLLGVAGEVEDDELLSRCLRSSNPKVRSQVVETLEKTCETSIFRLLQPLVEDIPYNEKISHYLKRGHKALSLNELLDKISSSPAQMNQIIAATMKFRLNFPNWRETLRQQMSGQDEIFHSFAYELLES